MARYRKAPIDPFLAFLMAESGCKTMVEAAERTGLSIQHVKSFADKGVSKLETMAKLGRLFRVDTEVVASWISSRLTELADEADLSETA